MCTKYRPPSPKNIKRQLGLMFSEPINDGDIRPTDFAPMIGRGKTGELSVVLASFGMLGNWGGSPKPKPLPNVRDDKLSGTFKNYYQKHRCIIPAEGFYEWQEVNGVKVPFYFTRNDGLLFYFAGLWQRESQGMFSFSIVTTSPNDVVSKHHSRMPLAIENIEAWLDNENPLKFITKTAESAFSVSAIPNPSSSTSLFEDRHV